MLDPGRPATFEPVLTAARGPEQSGPEQQEFEAGSSFRLTEYHPSLEYDAILYTFFMLLRGGWALVDLTPEVSAEFLAVCRTSLGECGGGSAAIVAVTKPHWCSRRTWRLAQSKFTGPSCGGCGVFLAFHGDRDDQAKCESHEPSGGCPFRFKRQTQRLPSDAELFL